jgi:hypothetical protein
VDLFYFIKIYKMSFSILIKIMEGCSKKKTVFGKIEELFKYSEDEELKKDKVSGYTNEILRMPVC